MAPTEEHDNPAWPPGTVRLEGEEVPKDSTGARLSSSLIFQSEEDRSDEIILQPQPSSDPNDPLNWPKSLKYLNFGLAAFYALMVFALIDAATPTWAPMHEQLGYSYDTLNNSYAAGCASLAVGACVLIPFALKYGRRPIYIFSSAVQFGVCIWSAHQRTVPDLMLVNILSCFVGALAEVVVQMTVADVFFVNQRGTMNSLYFWSTRVGAQLTPLAAGYVTISQGWRWVWWWIAILFGLLLVALTFLYEETKFVFAAVEGVGLVDGTTTATKDDAPKDPELARVATAGSTAPKLTAPAIDPTIPRKTYKQRLALTTSSPGSLHSFLRHSYQPFQILFSVPGVFYMALVYGGMMVTSNVLVTTMSNWMTRPPYNFDADQIGLMSLAPFTGSTLGTLICGPLSDWLILYLAKWNKGIYEPEMRLWVMAAFAPFVPIGMVLFGVGLSSGWPWPVLAVGYGLCTFGTAPAGSIALTYITDAYTEIVGDAMVSVTFVRNACSTMFIFALPPWIAAAGLQNVYITIGVLLTAILFGCGVFIAFGKKFRFQFRNRYRYFATRQFEPRAVCKERKLKVIPPLANLPLLDIDEVASVTIRFPRAPTASVSMSPQGLRPRDLDAAVGARAPAARNRDESDGTADLVTKAGVLSLHASGAEPHYFGSSSMFSFSRVIHACVRQAVQEKSTSGIDSGLDDVDASISPCRLPSYEVGVALSNAYFENVHFQYPFLHEPTFRQWENNALGLGPTAASLSELFFVNMVYAVGALLKPNTRLLPQAHPYGQLLEDAASTDYQVLTARPRNLSGLALRQCIELGYHRNARKINLSRNISGLEMRKRAFWCAYQMDCAASVNLGLPLSLPIQEVDTEFPMDINDSALSETGIQGLPRRSLSDPVTTMSHALHQFRLRCIWARIYGSLYSNAAGKRIGDESYHAQVQSLRQELDDWMAATPPAPRRVGVPLCVFGNMEEYKTTYSETILLIYRGQLTSKEDVRDDVFLECMEAASNICYSSKRLYIGNPINYTWSTLHVLFLAGLTYLHCLWSSPAARRKVRYDSVSSIFTTCTMLLAIMAERWEGAAPYRDLFEALSSRALAMLVERDQQERPAVLPSPDADAGHANIEDMTQWAVQIADVGMPDAFGSLLSGLLGDFGEGPEFQDSLWDFSGE
ncbi:hypothetical protein ACJZ2D_000483 [Fusarium nematophilum]